MGQRWSLLALLLAGPGLIRLAAAPLSLDLDPPVFVPQALAAPVSLSSLENPPPFVLTLGRLAHEAISLPFLLVCAPFNLPAMRANTYSLADVSDTITDFGGSLQGIETGVNTRLNDATRRVLPRSSFELQHGVEWRLYQIKF